jgi:hypothetical protein
MERLTEDGGIGWNQGGLRLTLFHALKYASNKMCTHPFVGVARPEDDGKFLRAESGGPCDPA